MQTRALVNYHQCAPERQAYEIDAGGVEGRIVSPPHAVTQVDVQDLRDRVAPVSFETDSVEFVKCPSVVSHFSSGKAWQKAYDDELKALLSARIGAREVIVFDHTVRIDDSASHRKPARNVHSDYSRDGAHQRVRDLVGDTAARDWELGHFAFVNVWRPVQHPIESAPLGFVRPRSVAPEDWLTLDLIYPDRVGQIMGLVANDAHEWLYLSNMTPDDVAIFNIYDNRGRPSIAHSALDLVDGDAPSVPRKSIESRTLVRYQDKEDTPCWMSSANRPSPRSIVASMPSSAQTG